jgi:hypothetical protein
VRYAQLFLELRASSLPCFTLYLGEGWKRINVILTPGFLKSEKLEYNTRKQRFE